MQNIRSAPPEADSGIVWVPYSCRWALVCVRWRFLLKNIFPGTSELFQTLTINNPPNNQGSFMKQLDPPQLKAMGWKYLLLVAFVRFQTHHQRNKKSTNMKLGMAPSASQYCCFLYEYLEEVRMQKFKVKYNLQRTQDHVQNIVCESGGCHIKQWQTNFSYNKWLHFSQPTTGSRYVHYKLHRVCF